MRCPSLLRRIWVWGAHVLEKHLPLYEWSWVNQAFERSRPFHLKSDSYPYEVKDKIITSKGFLPLMCGIPSKALSLMAAILLIAGSLPGVPAMAGMMDKPSGRFAPWHHASSPLGGALLSLNGRLP